MNKNEANAEISVILDMKIDRDCQEGEARKLINISNVLGVFNSVIIRNLINNKVLKWL